MSKHPATNYKPWDNLFPLDMYPTKKTRIKKIKVKAVGNRIKIVEV